MLFPIDQNVTRFRGRGYLTINDQPFMERRISRSKKKSLLKVHPQDNSNYHKIADLVPSVNSYTPWMGSVKLTPYHFRITGVNEYYSSPWIERQRHNRNRTSSPIATQLRLRPSHLSLAGLMNLEPIRACFRYHMIILQVSLVGMKI